MAVWVASKSDSLERYLGGEVKSAWTENGAKDVNKRECLRDGRCL